MKMSFCLLAALLMVAGCSEQSNPSGQGTNAAGSSGNPATAPLDYLSAATKAQRDAVKTVDTASLNQAIQLFNVDKGRNPKDLNELVQEKFIPQLPPVPYGMKLDYDAKAGKVKVVKE